ncbi:MAG: VWA domain-containing protein, partial [Candidatus Marinimicrobia bacterium]|nr:VWA domain-containing protein [Candidatus Neomarinimicrobiota bacterium]
MKFRVVVLFWLGLWITSFGSAAESISAGPEKISDVRVLIDISGSMKKNDPHNLRVPALRLIPQLIPDGQQSGVWTFGQYVNMMVKQGEVDSAWKDTAYKRAKEINSKGLFTNIESVLEKSTWDWNTPDDKTNRSIILLTDGVVDISKNAGKNADSRRRILKDILPRLKQAGVTIHTIALSDDADKAFLRQLSSSTEGWNEIVKDTSRLERIFLKMFEKAVPVETLPMTGNKVLVDDSIKELTLLVFRKEGAKTTILVSPKGKEFNQHTEQKGLRWRHEERYDLITIDKPMAGEWTVDAELDPDNRVMVVTDLKVRASRLPNMMLTEDVVSFYVELAEKGKTIRQPEFLDFVNVLLERSGHGEYQKTIAVTDDGVGQDKHANDGRFSTRLGGQLTAGEYVYDMQVDGMTFKRSKKSTVRVVEKPIAVTIKEEKAGNPAQYSLTLIPFSELINPDSLVLETTVEKQGGAAKSIRIPRAGTGEWRLDMKVKSGDIYDIKIAMQAERKDGRQVSYELGSFQLGAGPVDVAFDFSDEIPPDSERQTMAAEEPPPVADHHPVEEKHAPAAEYHPVEEEHTSVAEHHPIEEHHTPVAKHQPTEDQHTTEENDDAAAIDGEERQEEESPDWIMVAVKIIGLNGLLVGLGFFAYRKW